MAAIRIIRFINLDPRIRIYWLLTVVLSSNYLVWPALAVLVMLLVIFLLVRFSPAPVSWLIWIFAYGFYSGLASMFSGGTLWQSLELVLRFYVRLLAIVGLVLPFSREDMKAAISWILRPVPVKTRNWIVLLFLESFQFIMVFGARFQEFRINLGARGVGPFRNPIKWLVSLSYGFLAALVSECGRRSGNLDHILVNETEDLTIASILLPDNKKTLILQLVFSVALTLVMGALAILVAR